MTASFAAFVAVFTIGFSGIHVVIEILHAAPRASHRPGHTWWWQLQDGMR